MELMAEKREELSNLNTVVRGSAEVQTCNNLSVHAYKSRGHYNMF